MACRGVVTDPVAVGNFRIQVMDQVEEARGIAMDLGFMRLDGSRNMKILKGLVAEAYGDHPPLTAKGAIKTDRKTLQKSGNPQLKEYARNLNAEKLLNTYLPILEQGTRNPICSKPNVLVRSGRTSWKYPTCRIHPASLDSESASYLNPVTSSALWTTVASSYAPSRRSNWTGMGIVD